MDSALAPASHNRAVNILALPCGAEFCDILLAVEAKVESLVFLAMAGCLAASTVDVLVVASVANPSVADPSVVA